MTTAITATLPFHVLTKPIGPICNIACDHCFYLDKTKLFPAGENYRMTDEMLERFTRQYIEGHPPGTREINFAWQGGEPSLMGLDFYKRAVRLQDRYARPGIRITNAFQTNGTLLDDDWARFFHDHEFLVGISIDGPEELHDHYRKDRQGRGTFVRTMAGLEALRRHNVEFNTLTCIQRHNADHAVRVYDFLRDTVGSLFMQFIPIVVRVGGGQLSHHTVRPRQFGAFLNGIFDAWLARADVGRVYVQQFELMLGITAGYPPSLCVHSKTCGRSVALEHDGSLFSCDHYVNPENRLGSIVETTLAEMIDGARQCGFGLDKHRRLSPACLKCRYLRFCHGACPVNRVRQLPDGRDDVSYLCAGYKLFLAHSEAVFGAMAQCLRLRVSPTEYRRFMPRATASSPPSGRPSQGRPARNTPCPCGSGRKYKRCCGKAR